MFANFCNTNLVYETLLMSPLAIEDGLKVMRLYLLLCS